VFLVLFRKKDVFCFFFVRTIHFRISINNEITLFNFNSKGTGSGNALGFRISSLNKITMAKSNVTRTTLLHLLVEEAEKKDPSSLAFVYDLLEILQKASR